RRGTGHHTGLDYGTPKSTRDAPCTRYGAGVGLGTFRRTRPGPGGRPTTRLRVATIEDMMGGRPGSSLEEVLEVFEVFASGSLSDEVYVLDDVAGKRIAIAPRELKDKYRRG